MHLSHGVGLVSLLWVRGLSALYAVSCDFATYFKEVSPQVGQEGTAGGHMRGPGLYAGPAQGRWGWLTGGTYTRAPTGCGLCHFVWSGVLVPGGVCLTQRDDPDLPR